jgi:hypothetical protein
MHKCSDWVYDINPTTGASRYRCVTCGRHYVEGMSGNDVPRPDAGILGKPLVIACAVVVSFAIAMAVLAVIIWLCGGL